MSTPGRKMDLPAEKLSMPQVNQSVKKIMKKSTTKKAKAHSGSKKKKTTGKKK